MKLEVDRDEARLVRDADIALSAEVEKWRSVSRRSFVTINYKLLMI